MKKSFFKNSSTQIISLAVLSLVAVGLYAFSTEFFKKWNNEELNPFIASMPLSYAEAFEEADDNNEKLFHTVVENYATKELLIFRRFPKPNDLLRDFIVTVYPKSNKEGELIKLDITNSGVLYNHNNTTYAVFRKALPLVEIDRVEIKMKDSKNKLTGMDGTETAFANPYIPVFEEALDQSNLRFIKSGLEKVGDSLIQRSADISNYVSSQKVTVGTVDTPDKFWSMLEKRDAQLLKHINFAGNETKKATKLLSDYVEGSVPLDMVIEINQLARFEALKTIFTNGCSEPYFLIYNSTSNKLEPLFVSSKCIGKRGRKSNNPILGETNYLRSFVRIADSVALIDPAEDWLASNSSIKKDLEAINSVYPQNIFDAYILGVNQRILSRIVHSSTLLKSNFIAINKKELIIAVENVCNFPISVNALNYKKNKRIVTLSPAAIILPGKRDTVRIDLPRSFENLFVHKKSKTTGFIFEKDIYDLRLVFSIEGTDKAEMIGIRPYQPIDELKDDLFRSEMDLASISDISEDQKSREITFKTDSVVLRDPLIIPDGYTFKVSAGTTLNILKGGKIISNGPLQWKGTKERPIKVISSDKMGQGMLVLSGGKSSVLEHVLFTDLTNPTHGNWGVTGAVTFYESPVRLNYVTVENNRCEDALNIVRTRFTMDHCRIANTQSDAFDGDFVDGEISNSEFFNLGNDGIDVSGSTLVITNVNVTQAGDKGLSAGEDSEMKLSGIVINNSEIGIAGKDLSIITGDDIKINNNKLAFTAFKKKPEFGPSNIKLTNVSLSGIETEHLIENKSSLIVNGKQKETLKNVKSKMYGVEFGRSSKETRTSQ